MRRAVLCIVALAIAAPAQAAKPPAPVNADPFTVSGRFDLPHAEGSYVRRVKVGDVKIDAAMASEIKLDGEALRDAVRAAAERSLDNFGYLAQPAGADPLVLDVEILPLSVVRADGGVNVTAQVRFTPGVSDACLARLGEGRFRALDRQRSGGGRRTFAIGAAVALAFVYVNAANLVTTEFEAAAKNNQVLNGARQVGAGEGISPEFSEAGQRRYATTMAVQLAFADYLRQLGAAGDCRPAV